MREFDRGYLDGLNNRPKNPGNNSAEIYGQGYWIGAARRTIYRSTDRLVWRTIPPVRFTHVVESPEDMRDTDEPVFPIPQNIPDFS